MMKKYTTELICEKLNRHLCGTSRQKIGKWNKLDDTSKWKTFNKELDKEYKKTTDPTYKESYDQIYKTLVKIIRRKTITLY